MSVPRANCKELRLRSAAALIWLLVMLADACGAVAQEVSITVIHSFTAAAASVDGLHPGRLTLGPDGSLYGTTTAGGPWSGGTIFRMTMAGAVTTLHAFKGREGLNPDDCLVPGADGAFYGTTSLSPRTWNWRNRSSVFRITPQGEFNTVYVVPWNDTSPFAVVVKGVDGQAYGAHSVPNDSLASFALVGDQRSAATLPSILVVGSKAQVRFESTSPLEPVPAAFGGRPKQPLCGNQVADLYGRVWGATEPYGSLEKRLHGRSIPAPDGGVYALSGSEVVHVTRAGQARTLLSLATLWDRHETVHDAEIQGLILSTDGYVYGQVRTVLSARMFRFRLDGPLEVLKMPPDGAPTAHVTDLVELPDGSFVGPADGAGGENSTIVRIVVHTAGSS